jgi:hypothetical protein
MGSEESELSEKRNAMDYLGIARKAKADFQKERQGQAEPARPTAVDQIIDDRTIAVLIDSTALGATIWFALRDDWRPDEGDLTPVFYASELPALREKTLEQLRTIFNVKTVFGGGKVLDTGKNCWNCGATMTRTKDIKGTPWWACWECAKTV